MRYQNENSKKFLKNCLFVFRELLELPYVKECLALSGSKLVEQDTVVKKVKSRKGGKSAVKPVPKEKGVEAVLAYMKEKEASSVCQNNALKALQELVGKGKEVSGGGKIIIATMMRKHIAKEDVQTTACRLLAILATKGRFYMFYTVFIQYYSGITMVSWCSG